jgi:hypothetical protein
MRVKTTTALKKNLKKKEKILPVMIKLLQTEKLRKTDSVFPKNNEKV